MSPHRDPIADRLVERFRESGVVVPLKTSGPTIAISGRKYALSDYWSVMEGLEESSSGARLILPEGPTNKFRYLWAFDTEKRVLAMWRVSDGDEKAFGRENQHSRDLVILEKKRQLNRVTTDEFRAIERFMRGRQDDALAAMKKYLEENADEWDRESRRLVEEFFSKNIEPKILAKFREIDQGVVPFGFKPNESHRPPLEAAKMHVAMAIFGKEFTLKDVENFIKIKGIDPENPPGDIQALDWARHDVMDAFYEAYFPHVASE
jgi:IS1 family transposase